MRCGPPSQCRSWPLCWILIASLKISCAIDGTRDSRDIKRRAHLTPADHLRQYPGGVRGQGELGAASVERDRIAPPTRAPSPPRKLPYSAPARIFAGMATYSGRASMAAATLLLAGTSSHAHASRRASIADEIGIFINIGSPHTEDFFRACGHSSALVAMICRSVRNGNAVPGSPTQNPSMRLDFKLPAINGGGTTTRLRSLSGSTPAAASQ